MCNTEENIFYVYVYLDPMKPGHYVYDEYVFDHEPFYVGKGCNGRIYQHLYIEEDTINKSLASRIKKIQTERHYNPLIMKYQEGLTEQQSIELEGHMIDTIGRLKQNQGPLYNKVRSGDVIKKKKKMTSNMIVRKDYNGMLHKHHSEESKRKMGDSIAKYEWIVICPDGSTCKTKNLSRFCKERKMRRSGLHRTSKNGGWYYGYQCKKIVDNREKNPL